MPEIIKNTRELPPRLQSLLSELQQEQAFICAIKTDLKPNATIPILWLFLTKSGLLLCNTHRTRGLFASHTWQEINIVRKLDDKASSTSIEIIYNDISKDNTVLPFPKSVKPTEIDSIIKSCAELQANS